MLGLAVLLGAGTAALVLFLLRPSPSHTSQAGTAVHNTAQPTTAPPSTGATTASSSPQFTEQQAASSLAKLLAQSVSDRTAIVNAVSDVSNCGPTLSQDPQTFETAASSRRQMLNQLASLPARSALPAQMLQTLTSAWQASATADQDLARWAQDESSQGCTQNDQADPNFKAANGPDEQATTDKKAFVSQWNPIASKYGLAAYQWNQL